MGKHQIYQEHAQAISDAHTLEARSQLGSQEANVEFLALLDALAASKNSVHVKDNAQLCNELLLIENEFNFGCLHELKETIGRTEKKFEKSEAVFIVKRVNSAKAKYIRDKLSDSASKHTGKELIPLYLIYLHRRFYKELKVLYENSFSDLGIRFEDLPPISGQELRHYEMPSPDSGTPLDQNDESNISIIHHGTLNIITRSGGAEPDLIMPRLKTVHIAGGRLDDQNFTDSAFVSSQALHKTHFFEVLEGHDFVTDSALIDIRPNKPFSKYRTGGLRTLVRSLQDNNPSSVINDACLAVDELKRGHLLSVGSPKTCPTARIAMGYSAAKDNPFSAEAKNLYYFYDLSPSDLEFQDNFGDGMLAIPRVTLKDIKGNFYRPVIETIDGVPYLKEDWALLTIVANPFNHMKHHICVSACHGIGCLVLPELMNTKDFQQETRYIDFLDRTTVPTDFYQALLKVRTFWNPKQQRYSVDQTSKFYEVVNFVDDRGLSELYGESEAITLYQKIMEEAQAARN